MDRSLGLAPVRNYCRSYLIPVTITIVVGPLLSFVWGNSAFFKGQSQGILLPLFGLLVSMVMWLLFRSHEKLPVLAVMPLLALVALWFVAFLRTESDSSGYNYLVVITPLLLAMVQLKPPDACDVVMAARVLCLTIVASALVAEAWSLVSGTLVIPARDMDYSLLAEILGTTKRWVGPFLQENYAGPIAAYVLVFAITQRGWFKWIIVPVSAWMMIASTSSASVFGAVVGLAIVGVFATTGPLNRYSRRIRAWISVGGLVALAVLAALRDPTFNARSTVWSSYWDVWLSDPLSGVGTAGINEALRSGQIELYWTHAHNSPLDLLVRFGIIGLLLILFIYTTATWSTFLAARVGNIWPLAIVAMFIVIGLVEVPGNWLAWNIPMLWIVLAILYSHAPPADHVSGRAGGGARSPSMDIGVQPPL